MFDFSEINKNAFDKIAGINDTIFDNSDPLSNKFNINLEEIIRSFKIAGNKVLEVGCGTGDLAIYLANAGYNVTGIDFSENMSVVCRNKLRVYKESIKKRNELVKNPRFVKDNDINKLTVLSNVNPIIKFITEDISLVSENLEQYNIIVGVNFLSFISENKLENVIENISKKLYKNGIFIICHFTEAYYNTLELKNVNSNLFDYSIDFHREKDSDIEKTELKILRSDMVKLPFEVEFYEKIYHLNYLHEIAKKNNLNIIKIVPDIPMIVSDYSDLNEILSSINISFNSNRPVSKVIMVMQKQ